MSIKKEELQKADFRADELEYRRRPETKGKNPDAVALGRLGGKARAKRMAERQADRKAEQKELHTPSPAKPKCGTFLQEATGRVQEYPPLL